MGLYVNGKKNLKFVSGAANSPKTKEWKVGDVLSVWVRRRDVKEVEWLMSVFVNYNRVFTCNPQIPEDIPTQNFRIICESGGYVSGVEMVADARPPTRLGLNFWFNPNKNGAQKIIENIIYVDDSTASKRPLKVDWTMSMSPCNISHTQTKSNKILEWSNQPITAPLTRLPTIDDSLAIKCSKLILVFMGEHLLQPGVVTNTEARAKVGYTSVRPIARIGRAKSGIARLGTLIGNFFSVPCERNGAPN